MLLKKEHFKSFGALLKILAISFLDHNSKNNQSLKKASTKVLFRTNYLSFDISNVKIRAFILPEKLFSEKKTL